MRIALGIEYDGRAFKGWQYLGPHRDVRTVQGCLQAALSRIADHHVEVVCAGRTDSGVHALGQVIHFDTQAARAERGWVLGANSELPDDLSVTWAREVAVDFHARHAATARTYRYVILNAPARSGVLSARVTFDHRPINTERMQAAAASLIGEHDFSAFRSAECQSRNATRDLRRLEVKRYGEYVILDVEANAFLHHMVRNLVGVLLAIGRDERGVDWAREVLESRNRREGGVTAPAAGLYLLRVSYPAHFGIPEPRRAWWPDSAL